MRIECPYCYREFIWRGLIMDGVQVPCHYCFKPIEVRVVFIKLMVDE